MATITTKGNNRFQHFQLVQRVLAIFDTRRRLIGVGLENVFHSWCGECTAPAVKLLESQLSLDSQ